MKIHLSPLVILFIICIGCSPANLAKQLSGGDSRAQASVHVRIEADGRTTLDGQQVTNDELVTQIEKRETISATRDTRPRLIIEVDDGATCGKLLDVAKLAEASGCEQIGVVVGESTIHIPTARPLRAGTVVDEIPPFKLRLGADDKGDVAGIRLDEQAFDSFDQLQSLMIELLGDERGPGSIPATLVVELDADEQLKFKHFADAIRAASAFKAADGEIVTLADRFTFAGIASVEMEEIEEVQEIEVEPIEPIEVDVGPDSPAFDQLAPSEIEDVDIQELLESSDDTTQSPPRNESTAPKIESTVIHEPDITESPELTGRLTENRAKLVEQYGGSDESEKAVAAALRWLAAHQLADGGWSFDHREAAMCKGQCAGHGELAETRNAATAMALLVLLGAGQTHLDGEYKTAVKNGLGFLLLHKKPMEGGGSFQEKGGTMYSHGLAAFALCEALAMTGDMQLQAPAQAAIDFIEFAQDPVGGGWRYMPRQAGDTSVSGWQMLALRAGHRGSLRIKDETIRGAIKFLDSVAADDGAFYGYTTPAAGRHATTAIGLYSRMHLGWERDNPALVRGVKFLSEAGPRTGDAANMYSNYYATKVMFHFGGDEWKAWNEKMRDFLVESQDKEGHSRGGWFFEGDAFGRRAGRLYCTSLATLILETYYREARIYEDAEE